MVFGPRRTTAALLGVVFTLTSPLVAFRWGHVAVGANTAGNRRVPSVHHVGTLKQNIKPSPRGGLSLRAGATTTTKEEDETSSFEFSADVSRVMEIIINSLYSDKDVFLRELVSNAADACDKKRFLAITEGGSMESNLKIKIKPDPIDKTLTVEDGGVGMTKDELINNLGKIAQSGTKKFAEALGNSQDNINLIGQFGVGFYSGFLVANKMRVYTKAKDSETYVWESDARSGFTVDQVPTDSSESIKGDSGTRIVLSLKDDCSDYLQEFKLRDLLKKYSEFVDFPIELFAEKTTYEKAGNETIPVTKAGYEVVNAMKPLWLRSPAEVTKSEYSEFYKAAFRAYDEPMRWSHFALEGQVQFRSVLFVPGILPYELSRNMFDDDYASIKLYVKRVFINDKFAGGKGDELLPRWLAFVRGIVDSEDLPLNVGREILQKSKMLSIIKKRLIKKSLDMFNSIAKNATEYDTFWSNYGKYLKVGVVEEQGETQKEIAKLCRFFSTTKSGKKDGNGLTTLNEYVSRMKPNATKILYVSGDSRAAAMASPVLERLKKEDYEVLVLTEPLDELVCQSIGEFDGKLLVDAGKEDIGDVFADEDSTKSGGKNAVDDDDASFDDLKTFLTDLFGSQKVAKVTISKRLTDSPAALVQGAYGMSPMMRKYMQAQAATTGNNPDVGLYGVSAPTLEINPSHPVILELKKSKSEDTAKLVYDLAAITSGYELDDAAAFAARVNALLVTNGKNVHGGPSSSSSSQDAEKEEDDDDDDAKDVEVLE